VVVAISWGIAALFNNLVELGKIEVARGRKIYEQILSTSWGPLNPYQLATKK